MNGCFKERNSYVCLNKFYVIDSKVVLDQYIVMTDNNIQGYYLWITFLAKEALTNIIGKNYGSKQKGGENSSILRTYTEVYRGKRCTRKGCYFVMK